MHHEEKYKVNTKSQITITHTHHKIKTCTHACDCAICMYGEFLVSEHWVQNIMLNKTQKLNSMKHNAEAVRDA